MAGETAPRGLQRHGRKLWRDVVKVYDLRVDELRVLEAACREVDLIARIDDVLADEDTPLTVKGSMGQLVAHPLVQEVRQHRTTLRALLNQLGLPDEPSGAGEQTRSEQARQAAGARWKRGA